MSVSIHQDLAAKLRASRKPLPSVAIGLDGFVDEMIRLVGERQSLTAYTPVQTITAFADLVARAAGHSSLREIVVTAIHAGGCAVNMGDGLACLGVPVDCFATLGDPPHPAFSSITERFRSVQTWGREPGRTLAFEFADGKLMFSSVTQLAELTPEKVAALITDGSYTAACHRARLIALTDWALYPHMTAVWQSLQRDVYAALTHRPCFFIDLVDPSSRTPDDISAMLSVLNGFERVGPLTLGLNGNEANILSRLLDLSGGTVADPDSARSLAASLRARLEVSEVVIHHIKFAAVSGPDGDATVFGPYCANPKKSTGAGDRFNAGYALGHLLQLTPVERLLTASACSGYFVREARSPNLLELAEFIGNAPWP